MIYSISHLRPYLFPRIALTFLATLLAFTGSLAGQQPRRQPPAKEYIQILEAPHRVERLKISEVIKILGVKPGETVADIGSGSGVFTRPLARTVRPGGKVFAVDIDPELLEFVSKTAKEQGISNITTILGENDSPSLPPSLIDLALICDTLHHIENRETYLKNLRPSLKPDGRLAIIDFLDEWPGGHESMKFTPADLAKWTQESGFVKVSEHNTVQGNFFHIYKLAMQATRSSAQPRPVDQPITVAYYYKVKWGYQDEFLELFKRNHYPVLEAQIDNGRLLSVHAYTPRFHGEGRSDWTFLTVLVFKNWNAFGDNSGEQEIMKQLYPDQEKFRREERRRFELLEAHWDVPLTPVPMK